MEPDRLGKYEIRGTLGKGAMGTVYEGWDPIISRKVAIKTVRLPDAADIDAQEELERFKREAQAAGRLQHPNIVGIFDYGETDQLAYIVMEFVDGRTLKSILDSDERMPVAQIGRIMTDVLSGLRYSHERGVIHRDIKPANIMITGGDGQAKIADFGIARIESSNLTQAGTIMGTPAYMSPEQFMGQTVDARTDIYSSGVMLFQLLTGDRPFEGSMATIMHKVLNTVPPKPSDLSVTAPVNLDPVVARAMARRPEDRYPTALAFCDAMQAALEQPAPASPLGPGLGDLGTDATVIASAPKPAVAVPPPTPVRPVAERKSRTPLIAAAAVVVLALAGGGAWFAMSGPANPGAATGTRPATPASRPEGVAAVEPPNPPPAAPAAVQPAAPMTAAPVPAAPVTAAPVTATPSSPEPPAPRPQVTQVVPPQVAPPASQSAATPRSTQTLPAVQPAQIVPPAPATTERAPPPPATRAQAAQALPPPVPAETPRPQEATPPPAPAAVTPPQSVPAAAPTIQPAAPEPATTAAAPPPAAVPASVPAPAAPTPSAPVPAQAAAPIVQAAPGLSPDALRRAIVAAVAQSGCAVVTGDVSRGGTVELHGVVGGGQPQLELQSAVRDAAPVAPVDWAVGVLSGPYCGALDAVRALARPFGTLSGGVELGLKGDKPALAENDKIEVRTTMPGFATYLQLDYFSSDGSVAHFPRVARAGSTQDLLIGEVAPPFGTDLIVATASSAPLFGKETLSDNADAYARELRAALEAATRRGTRLATGVLMVRTSPRP